MFSKINLYIVIIHLEKITKNITFDVSEDFYKTEKSTVIYEHLVQPENSSNKLSFDKGKMRDVSKILKRLNVEIQAVKVFIKEQFVNVKEYIENVVVKIDNKENKEVLDLICQ